MKELFQRLLEHDVLLRDETRALLLRITREELPQEQIAALLSLLQQRGITVDELLGFRDGILETGVPVRLQCDRYIDIVGTGGDQKNTFNISTAACFVVAGAGYKVVKHGNFAATSVSGASNVMQNHGVVFTDNPDILQQSLDKSNMVYLHAPLFAKAMKFVAPVRKALPFPTCFNLLGPLVNPSQPPCQLLGVATLKQLRLYGSVNERIGVDYGIVNSIDGYDEISLTGPFKVKTRCMEQVFSPADVQLPVAEPQDLYGGSTPAEAVAIFDSVLNNTATQAQLSVVIINAAFAIYVLENEAKSIEECVQLAKESIESGRARTALKKFLEINS